MKKLLLIFICTFFLTSCTKSTGSESKPVVKGVFDAENIIVGDIQVLEGDWIFIPNKFVNPSEDFRNTAVLKI